MGYESYVRAATDWFYETRAQTAMKNLERNGIATRFARDRDEARAVTLDMIPPGVTVGRADSLTVDQVGIMEALQKRGLNELMDPLAKGSNVHDSRPDDEGRKKSTQMLIRAMLADVFLTGTSAVTLDGKLVNVDGRGNRVGPIIFGPEKVILLVSAAKIVADVEEALHRIHNIAAPINNKRIALEHNWRKLAELPCALTGKCADCKQEWRTCRYTVIIEGTMPAQRGRINLVLIGERLGI